MSCSLWCGSGQYADQDVHTLIKIPAFVGMTGSAGTAESAVMTVRTGIAPETCNSSPGNANLRIGTQAGHDQDSHPDPQRKYALRYSSSISPTHDAVIAPFRRYVHLPAPSLYTPALRPPFGVIPAKAGILTRVALDEGRAVVVNCAGIPSRHFSSTKCVELCALKSLMWIRAKCHSKRP